MQPEEGRGSLAIKGEKKQTEKPKHEQKHLWVFSLIPRVPSSRPGEGCPTNEAVQSPGSRAKAVRKFKVIPQPHYSLIPVPTALEGMLYRIGYVMDHSNSSINICVFAMFLRDQMGLGDEGVF